MTKLPHPDWEVRGVEGPKYRVGPRCAVAGCAHWADHAHHMWRRSFLAGDYKWVELWDGRVIQNICALCFDHHELITVNKAAIVFNDVDFRYELFEEVKDEDTVDAVLIPQPKELSSFVDATALKENDPEVFHDHEEPPCPTCGKRTRKKSDLPPGEKRNRATWSVSVPKDERENGADVLDTLEMECAIKLGREDHSSHKYFVLAEVMAHFLMSTTTIGDFVESTPPMNNDADDDGA